MLLLFNEETGGHGGDLAEALEKWNPPGGKFIDFSSNINPLGPPPGLLKHLRNVMPEMISYPTPQARILREELARFFEVSAQRLVVGNGANELIHFIILHNKPGRVFVPAPSFSEYERAANLSGSEVIYYSIFPEEKIYLEKLPVKPAEQDLIVVCNPNNPTGTIFPRSDLLELIDHAEKAGASVMLDESFMLLTGTNSDSLCNFPSDNLWVVVSLTKLWGLPGLRLGCMIGPAEEINRITRYSDPWRVNTIAQKAGLYCIKCHDYLNKTLELINTERSYLVHQLTGLKCFEIYKGAANYLLIKGVSDGFNVIELQSYLAGKGILIRRADNFKGLDHRFFRIAIKKRIENKELVRELTRWVQKEV
ncbi:MAG: threonine-phosphate decarboxylase [Bacillota bacterium]|nr:threonine-phosphate decarboxylase [Bacillota bacterium]